MLLLAISSADSSSTVASALAAACYTFGEKILARAGLAATNLQPASLLVTTAGAARQKWHRDTDADETYSMLLAVTDRQFHVDGIQETVHLEPGDVILFKAQLRHAGAGLDKDDQCFDAGRHGLVSIGMHMYAGKGLIPSEHTCFSYDVGDNKPMRISESFDYRDADAPDVTAATILMPTRLVQPNGLEDNPESLEGPPSDVEVFMPVNPNRLTGKLHRESGLKRSREAATKDAASWLPGATRASRRAFHGGRNRVQAMHSRRIYHQNRGGSGAQHRPTRWLPRRPDNAQRRGQGPADRRRRRDARARGAFPIPELRAAADAR